MSESSARRPAATAHALAWLWGLLLLATACGVAPAGDTRPPAPDPASADPAGQSPPSSPAPPPSEAGFASPPTAGCERARCYRQPLRTGVFDVERIPEASGLAASRRNPGVLWLLDDGPGATGVWAVRADGDILGLVEIEGLDGVDTEGLAVSQCPEGDAAWCLYVGDIGDNARARESVSVYRIPEPDLGSGLPDGAVTAARARLRYPDGPQNAEALLVAGGVPHVVTKAVFDSDRQQTGPTRLFAAGSFADGELRDLGVIPLPPASRALLSPVVGEVVTGATLASAPPPPRVLLRTYDHVVEYRAPDAAGTLAGLPRWEARELPGPVLPQSEAIAYAPDGCGWYTVSEGVGDIWYSGCAP